MTFLTLDSDFFGEKLGSLLSLQLVAVPQTQEAIERNAISDKRGHYENPMRALNTTLLKCCQQLTLFTSGKNFTPLYQGSR